MKGSKNDHKIQIKYLHCNGCNCMVSSDFQYLHEIECHKMKNDIFKFSHSFIKDDVIYGRVMVVEDSQAYKLRKNTKIYFDKEKSSQPQIFLEPEWVKRLKISFTSRIIYINPLDMYICGIQAFSPVSLSIGIKEEIFLAIPYEDQSISYFLIYESGFQRFYLDNEQCIFKVKKIDKIDKSKSIKLDCNSLLTYSDIYTLKKYIKNKYRNTFTIGFPFILKNNDEILLEFLEKLYISINQSENKLVDDKSFNTTIDELNQSRISDDTFSESIVTTLSENLKISFNESLPITISHKTTVSQNLDRTVKESLNNTNFKSNKDLDNFNCTPKVDHSQRKKYSTSTPLDSSSSSIKNSSKKRSKKKNKRDSKNIFYEVNKANLFYCDNNTCFNIKYKYENKNEDVDEITDSFYHKDETYYSVMKLITKKLDDYHNNKFSFSSQWTGISLSGHSGTGKSALVQELSHELDLPLVTISLAEWTKSNISENEFMLLTFQKVKDISPSILFFDEIDSLCAQNNNKINNGFITSVYKIINEVKKLTKPIILICASSRPHIMGNLSECGKFDREIILNLPDCAKKCAILHHLLRQYSHDLIEDQLYEIADCAHGFSVADLHSLVMTAVRKAYKKGKGLTLCFDDLKTSIPSIVPSFLRQNYTSLSKVLWSDIHGYEDVKKDIKGILEQYKRGESGNLKGILLYGPPGCSKTMLVKAIATETKFSYFPIKCSDLLSKYVGETEKSLSSVFRRAIMSVPSLIFMDEIDSLCGDRSGQSGTEASVVTELLSLIKGFKDKGILVVGATNRPHAVDPTLLSAGYLELVLHIDLPDCSSRCAIWKGILEDVPQKELDISLLCEYTKCFSGAEIVHVYQKAAQLCLKECNYEEKIFLTQRHFDEAIKKIKPRTSPSLLASINKFTNNRNYNPPAWEAPHRRYGGEHCS